MSLRDAQNMVRAFQKKFDLLAPDSPRIPHSVVPMFQRERWIADELDELHGALFLDNELERLAGIADAYIDIIVFALGGLVELGVDGTPLFDAVMRANMGKVKVPGVAKIQKPEGFVHPDIGALIEEQRRKP